MTIVLTDAQGEPKTREVEFSEQTQRKLPKPAGYQILIALPDIEEKTEGGIIKPHESQHHEQVASVVGFVLAMGPDCYKDPERFPSGPYCAEGDFVVFHPYSGTRLKVHGKEFRLINDDTVKAVVDDPRGIVRA